MKEKREVRLLLVTLLRIVVAIVSDRGPRGHSIGKVSC